MHYLAFEDVQDRFLQLNKIVLDTYPTYWPNVIISVFLAAILSASVAGIVQTGTNYSVVGQGGCFLLPITIVLWAKIRKETKARACKRTSVPETAQGLDNAGHGITRHAMEVAAEATVQS
ncbi:hypothetical protein BGZ70_004025 [Mortierella alpina]|uniref:Uncharacterized protein n=1 Tax=Mortierella alpina TaxID=64518 RepID=A0A9P6JAD6_MORAP|nr:hypothetical protein BGZ70_004025 [Mortierella alpina]